jgi:hypothetical protein
MRLIVTYFLRDDSGSAVIGDWVFVATILVLGAVAGAAALHSMTADEPVDGPSAVAPMHPASSPAAVAATPAPNRR